MGILRIFLLLALAVSPTVADRSYFSVTSKFVDYQYDCLPQHYPEKSTQEWNKISQRLTLVRSTSDCLSSTGDEFYDRDSYTFSVMDLGKVNGTVAVVQGSSCLFKEFSHYYKDYSDRLTEVRNAGAIGVIFAEGHEGKLPQVMDSLLTGDSTPVCIMSHRLHSKLVQLLSANGASDLSYISDTEIYADFTNMHNYRTEDEPVPNPVLTSISILNQPPPEGAAAVLGGPVGNMNTLDFAVPALTATFNPESVPSSTERATAVELIPACWGDSFADCTECWQAGSPFVRPDELTGQVAFYDFEEAPPVCFPFYFQWAQLAEMAGASGVVFGTSDDHFYHVPGMYLAGVGIPFFSLMSLHAEALRELLLPEQPNHVFLQLPELIGRSGPPYFASDEEELGLAVIGAWTRRVGEAERHHFMCEAGQATYNPLTFDGVQLPQEKDAIGNMDWFGITKGELAHATPVAECTQRETCAKCLTSSLHVDADLSTLDTPVVLMNELDFVCFHSYMQYTLAAVYIGAAAVVIVNADSFFAYTMGAAGADADYRAKIPSFNINLSCGSRMEEDEEINVHLPAIVNGSAVLDEMAQSYLGYTALEDELEDATIFLRYEGLRIDPGKFGGGAPENWMACPDYKCQVGQVGWNPRSYRSIEAEVLPVTVRDECSFQSSCVQCDSLPDKYLVINNTEPVELRTLTAQDVFGKIPIIHYMWGFCLHPLSNIVYHFQEMGAVGMLLINEQDTTHTFQQVGIPFDIHIPSFNLNNQQGNSMFKDASLKTQKLYARLPRLEKGIAIVDSIVDVELTPVSLDNLQGIADPFFGELGVNIEPTAPSSSTDSNMDTIIIGAVAAVLGLILLTAGAWWVRRQRALFAYNQFDMAVQTGDAFLDIGSVDPLGEDQEDLMRGRAVEDGDRVAVFDIDSEDTHGDLHK